MQTEAQEHKMKGRYAKRNQDPEKMRYQVFPITKILQSGQATAVKYSFFKLWHGAY